MNKIFIVIIYLFVTGCSDNQNKTGLPRVNSKDTSEMVGEVYADDIEMNNARSDAKNTYDNFVKLFKEGCDSCTGFQVKIRFSDGDDNVEHMWLDELKIKENKITGILVGTPEKLLRLQTGDIIEVNKDSLSDWMYIKGSRLIGGFTIRYFYDKMSREEQLKLEDDLGATIN